MDFLFYLLLPFSEIGPSYYASVGTVLAVLVIIQFWRPMILGLGRHWHLAALTLFMFPSLLTGDSTDFGQDTLRIAREALIIILMIGMFNGAFIQPSRIRVTRLSVLTVGMLIALLGVTLFQYVSLSQGRYIGIPKAWFAQGTGTIANDLSLKFSHLRPSAAFSEPSYLAFVILSLVFMMTPGRDMKLRLAFMIVLALAIGLLSQAASFVMFAVLIFATYVYDNATPIQRLIGVPFAVLALPFVIAVGSHVGPIARAMEGGNANGDFSIFIRIFGPLQVLPEYLVEHPVGVPFSALFEVLLPYTNPLGIAVEDFLHNSVFNMLFEYGFLGLFPLIAILYVRNNTVRAYLISCMLFNGAFLSLDKLAIVGFAVSVYGAMNRRSLLRDAVRRERRAHKARARMIGVEGRFAGFAR